MASAISNKSSPIHTSTILYRLWPHAVLTVCNSLRHHSISIITRWEKGAEEEGERRSRTHITHTLRAQVVLLQINLIIIKSLPATTANIPEDVCVHTHAPISLYISMHEGSAILLCKKKKKKFNRLKLLRNKNVPFKRHAPQNLMTPQFSFPILFAMVHRLNSSAIFQPGKRWTSMAECSAFRVFI